MLGRDGAPGPFGPTGTGQCEEHMWREGHRVPGVDARHVPFCLCLQKVREKKGAIFHVSLLSDSIVFQIARKAPTKLTINQWAVWSGSW